MSGSVNWRDARFIFGARILPEVWGESGSGDFARRVCQPIVWMRDNDRSTRLPGLEARSFSVKLPALPL